MNAKTPSAGYGAHQETGSASEAPPPEVTLAPHIEVKIAGKPFYLIPEEGAKGFTSAEKAAVEAEFEGSLKAEDKYQFQMTKRGENFRSYDIQVPGSKERYEDLSDMSKKREIEASVMAEIRETVQAQQMMQNPGMQMLMFFAMLLGGGRDAEEAREQNPEMAEQIDRLSSAMQSAERTETIDMKTLMDENLTDIDRMAGLALTPKITENGNPISTERRAELLGEQIEKYAATIDDPAARQAAIAHLSTTLTESDNALVDQATLQAALEPIMKKAEFDASLDRVEVTPDGNEVELTWVSDDGRDFKVELKADQAEKLVEEGIHKDVEQLFVLASMEQTPEVQARMQELAAELAPHKELLDGLDLTYDHPGLFNNDKAIGLSALMEKLGTNLDTDKHAHVMNDAQRDAITAALAGKEAAEPAAEIAQDAAPLAAEAGHEPAEWVKGYHEELEASLVADLQAMGAVTLAANATWGPEDDNPVREALMDIQQELGIAQTGILDSDTFNTIQNALEDDASLPTEIANAKGFLNTREDIAASFTSAETLLETVGEALDDNLSLRKPNGEEYDLSAIEIEGGGYDLDGDGKVDEGVTKTEAIASVLLDELAETFRLSDEQQEAIAAMKGAFQDKGTQGTDVTEVGRAIGGVSNELQDAKAQLAL